MVSGNHDIVMMGHHGMRSRQQGWRGCALDSPWRYSGNVAAPGSRCARAFARSRRAAPASRSFRLFQ